jgi:glycosyltransferase involved in cell wall biosynthesis
VIGSIDPKNGGTTHHVLMTSRVWKRFGHECHVLSLDSPEASFVADSPMHPFALGDHSRLYHIVARILPIIKYGYTPRLGRWFRKHARDYDIVMLNGLWNFTSYGTWVALRRTDTPYIVFPHGMLDPWTKEAQRLSHLFRLIYWQFFERKVLRDARAIFFASEEEKQLAQSLFLKNDAKSYVLGFGTEDVLTNREEQKIAFLSQFPKLRGRKLILYLGRIHPKKGLDLLIEAFAQLVGEIPSFDLVIAGPDELGTRARLERIAYRKAVTGRIHWTDMLTGDLKFGAYFCSEFFVLPSHQENFGIAVVEALALGVPVVISKKVNIWREVLSEGAGLAVTDDVAGVKEGLRRLCNLPQHQLRRMKVNARNCFLKRFNLELNANELISLMRRSLQ